MVNCSQPFIRQLLFQITFLFGIAAAAQSGWQQPGNIEEPHGTWQIPGPIQQPNRPWQKPGAIQVPKGIQAIKQESLPCESRISIGADALFDSNRSDLRSDATETLEKLGPIIRQFGTHPIEIDGHTDAIGSLSYNQQLSEARAETVKAWLMKGNLHTSLHIHQRLRKNSTYRSKQESGWQRQSYRPSEKPPRRNSD